MSENVVKSMRWRWHIAQKPTHAPAPNTSSNKLGSTFVSVASLSLLVMEQTKCVVLSDVVACGCALLWSVVCGCVGGEMSKKKYLENELGVPNDCSPWCFTQKRSTTIV